MRKIALALAVVLIVVMAFVYALFFHQDLDPTKAPIAHPICPVRS